MDRLENQFNEQVDFFRLDVDNPEARSVLQEFNIRQRSTYALIDAEGNVVKLWIGYLDEDMVAAELQEELSKL